ncbi:MAG: hypothetical protein Q9225_005122 [Loekoesia sp. 1 TL-2023]
MPIAEAQEEWEGVEGRDPSPDFSKKTSRGNDAPKIVIPSTEIYGSETPSPLSPITPPDRLSPIEELDDNASLLSNRVAKHAQFETSAHQESTKPRTRPKSNDFELQATIETGGIPLEVRSELLFSRQHLELIFADKELSARFGTFLRTYRPDSVPILGYYLDTIKALRTLKYAEAVVKNLERIPGLEFTAESKGVTMTWVLEDKADRALDILAKNDLPAFIAYVYVCIVDLALVERVTGKADVQANDVAIGLAEVFTISDPSRPDNPLVFASDGTFPLGELFQNALQAVLRRISARTFTLSISCRFCRHIAEADALAEFHRMTQYPSNIALGRNCRFLGGPKTDPNAIGRDQNGKVRYYLGAQLDITELVNTCTGLESLRKLIARQSGDSNQNGQDDVKPHVDLMAEFQQLSETFTTQELQTLLKSQERQQLDDQVNHGMEGYLAQSARVRNSSANLDSSIQLQGFGSAPPLGFYQNYLLVRPHPSLRILFASPDLRVPGILQSPLMGQIGGSARVRDDLYHALEAGQKVTAKVQWLSKSFQDGRARWIHCTPLISANGLIGVWMVILVDDDEEPPAPSVLAQSEPLPNKIGLNDVPAPTPWESTKIDRVQQNDTDRSPSTADSSQTAFSDSAKPIFEKIPSAVKGVPETVSLPFASTKMKTSNAGVVTTDFKCDAQPATDDWIEAKLIRKSTESAAWSRSRQNRPHFDQPPDVQPFLVRPGPRIAGKAYSFDSNSEHGISADDERNSIGSRSGGRPASQESNTTAIRSKVQPPDIRWRKVEDQGGVPGRGGRAAIKLPGRPSQEGERPMVWKTKKSLSPYGFLFND